MAFGLLSRENKFKVLNKRIRDNDYKNYREDIPAGWGQLEKSKGGVHKRGQHLMRSSSDWPLDIEKRRPAESCRRFELRKEHNIHKTTPAAPPSKVELRQYSP